MKTAPRSRLFAAVCGIYLFCVLAAFVVGLAVKDYHGVTFFPAVFLTLPWFYILPFIAERFGFISPLTAYHDLLLFAISAFINVGVAETIRRIRARASESFVSITPQ